jgi:hypothetical protein
VFADTSESSAGRKSSQRLKRYGKFTLKQPVFNTRLDRAAASNSRISRLQSNNYIIFDAKLSLQGHWIDLRRHDNQPAKTAIVVPVQHNPTIGTEVERTRDSKAVRYETTSLVETLFHGKPCRNKVVPKAGLEPARLAAGDFESPASTIPPLGHNGGLLPCNAPRGKSNFTAFA